MGKRDQFINGEFVPPASGSYFETVNPSTGEGIAEVARGCAEDVNRAVTAARSCFQSRDWKRLSGFRRGELLLKVASLIEREAERLAELETRDNGKPKKEALAIDIRSTAEYFRFFGGLAGKIRGSTIEIPGRFFNYTQVEPLGVCGAIIPWNYPLLMAARRSVPGIFMNAGQMCVAGSRLLVQDTAYDE